MRLIIEIILTIVAWNRGWRWKAIIPVGAGSLLGFIIGFIGGSLGYTVNDMSWVGIFDVFVIIALIIMCICKPKSMNADNKPEIPAK